MLLWTSDQVRSDQSLSRIRLFAYPWITARQASLSITNSRSSLRLTSIELGMPSSHLILCRPLLLLPSIPPSIRVFSNESTLRMRWPKYWNFSFSIILSKEIPGLISFRMDWLDLLAVQGTLCIYLFGLVFCILWIPRSRIAGSYSNFIFNFWGISILSSIVAVPIYIPTSSAQGFPFLHIFSNTCYFFVFFIVAILWDVRWYLIVI